MRRMPNQLSFLLVILCILIGTFPRLGHGQDLLGRFQEAEREMDKRIEEDLKQAIKNAANAPTDVGARLSLAQAYRRAGNSELALKEYRATFQLNPSHLPGVIELVNFLLVTHNYDEAFRVLQQGVSLNPRSAQLHQLKGEVYENKKKLAEAIGAYESAYKFMEMSTLSRQDESLLGNILPNLVRLYREHERLNDAIHLLENLAAHYPLQYLLIGGERELIRIYDEAGLKEKAQATLEQAVVLEAGFCVNGKIACEDSRNSFDLVDRASDSLGFANPAAKEKVLKLIHSSPSYFPFLDNFNTESQLEKLVGLFRRSGQTVEAEIARGAREANALANEWGKGKTRRPPNEVRSLLLVYPKSSVNWSERAIIYSQRGFPELAHRAMEKAWELGKSADAFALLGRRWELLDNPQEATRAYEKSLAVKTKEDVDLDMVVPWLASLYIQEKRYTDARELLERTIATDPNNVKAFELLAQAYLAAGQEAKAVGILTQAAKANPTNPIPHLDLGAEYFRRGQLDQAIQEYETALRLNPTSEIRAKVHTNLGLAYTAQGAMAEAMKAFEAAVALDAGGSEEKATAHEGLGKILAGQGELEKALGHFNAAAQLSSTNGDIQFNTGWLHHLAGHSSQARTHLDKARAIFQQAGNREKVAQVDERLRQVP